MKTISIPKNLSKKDDLIVISREEYEELSVFKKRHTFSATPTQKKALKQAEKNFLGNKTFSYNDLIKKLGVAN